MPNGINGTLSTYVWFMATKIHATSCLLLSQPGDRIGGLLGFSLFAHYHQNECAFSYGTKVVYFKIYLAG